MIREARKGSRGCQSGVTRRKLTPSQSPTISLKAAEQIASSSTWKRAAASAGRMIRVARSGACVVVSEPHWGTLAVDATDGGLKRRILAFRCDMQRSGWTGCQLSPLRARVDCSTWVPWSCRTGRWLTGSRPEACGHARRGGRRAELSEDWIGRKGPHSSVSLSSALHS